MGSNPYEKHVFYLILRESSPRSVSEMGSKRCATHVFFFHEAINWHADE